MAAILVAATAALGQWQLKRADEKQKRIDAFAQTGTRESLPDPGDLLIGQEVRLRGRFDVNRHVLADNQVWSGRPGVHVYTPFSTGEDVVLVNRGWLALSPDRSFLPEIPTTGEITTIRGRLVDMPGVGRRLGAALTLSTDQWPQLVTYPELPRIAEALGMPLYPQVLLLDEESPQGFAGRQWQAVYLSPEKHRAYAFQWFAMTTAVFVGWLILGLRRGRQPEEV